MKVSIDGGGLCAKRSNRYGNYVFSKNCLLALDQYDKKNTYYSYSFCGKPDWFPKNIIFSKLLPKQFWMSLRIPLEEFFSPKQFFLAFNQALPASTNAKIISFSHGLSFCYFPNLYQKSYEKMLKQLKQMVERSSWIVVSSEKVKRELKDLFPKYERVLVNPFGIPFDMISTRNKKREKYFMFVGMNHPIKNVDFFIKAFQKMQTEEKYSQHKLILVGNFKEYKKIPNIIYQNISDRKELKKLYQQASGYLTASLYESYNLPVLEALSQNCPVIGLKTAIIPEFSQYVYLAKDFDEFVYKMKMVADEPKSLISADKLGKEFNWEKYVKNLIALYD